MWYLICSDDGRDNGQLRKTKVCGKIETLLKGNSCWKLYRTRKPTRKLLEKWPLNKKTIKKNISMTNILSFPFLAFCCRRRDRRITKTNMFVKKFFSNFQFMRLYFIIQSCIVYLSVKADCMSVPYWSSLFIHVFTAAEWEIHFK